jgi:RNA-splicing ligase RtcB
MLQLVLRELEIEYDESRLIESTHKYIDFRRGILRKGAISAEADELCLVALNMKDGVMICRGKGNEDWNFSCAHGCGRHMSRSEAQRRIKLKDYQNAMRDVVSTSVCKETLDEAPQAYKDMGLVMEALRDTIDIVDHLTSVVNLKGTD